MKKHSSVLSAQVMATPFDLLKLYAAICSLYSLEGILWRLNFTPLGLTGDQSYTLKKQVFCKLILSCCNCFAQCII